VPRRTTARHVTVCVIGTLAQGMSIVASDEQVTLPGDRIERSEVVYRVAGDLPDVGLADRDLLVIEPRAAAATGEFVLATLQERAFVGRWWTKRGARSLLDNEFRVIVQGPELTVFGAVTLIARDESR
jgi:SOS-response transcriptional repressor LexA